MSVIILNKVIKSPVPGWLNAYIYTYEYVAGIRASMLLTFWLTSQNIQENH